MKRLNVTYALIRIGKRRLLFSIESESVCYVLDSATTENDGDAAGEVRPTSKNQEEHLRRQIVTGH